MAFNPWIPISELSISYPDFQWGAVANPDEIDINNSEIVGKINSLINKVNERFSATELPYADGSVITRHLLNKSVTSEKIADNAVTTIHIADGSITNAKMQSGGINTDNIIDGAITSPKIADNSVTNSKLEGNIEQSKILDNGYLTTRIDKKIESEIITNGNFNSIINLTGVGNLADLTTTNKENVVSAINEHENDISLVSSELAQLVDYLNYMPINGGDFDGNNPVGPIIDGGIY